MSWPDEEWGYQPRAPDQKAAEAPEALSRVRVFDALAREELRQVEHILHRRVYRPGEQIVRQGNPGLGMYIIESGSAEVVMEAEDGGQVRLATLGEGQFFGEMSLLDGAPRAASVVAAERCRVLGFFRADLMALIARDPRLGFRLVYRISQLMAGRLREALVEYRRLQQALRGA